GGMVTARDAARAERLRLLRAHGSRRKYHYEILGVNSRLDALQAAILRVKLRHLADWQRARQQHAALYGQLFEQYHLGDVVVLPGAPAAGARGVNQFVVRAKERDLLRGYLTEHGIATEICYPGPLRLQPAFACLGWGRGAMPHSEAACKETLA